MEPTRIFSLGYVAQLLQCDVSQIRLACDELGIAAATEINDVQHFAAADVRRLRNHFQKGKTNMGDTQTTSETRALEREHRELQVRADNLGPARQYSRRVEGLVRRGTPRPQAVRTAGRENPSGQKAFLLVTNHAPARARLTAKPKTVRRR